MATLSVTVNAGGKTAKYTLTYTVSSTNTQTTLTLSSVAISEMSGNYNINPQWQVIADGETLAVGSDGNYTFSGVTKAWTKGTASSSKTIRFTVYGQSASATITVPALASYNVTYNANGGSGAPATQRKYYGQALTLTTSKPSRSNHVFIIWNTSSDGTGSTYSPGVSYTENAAVTLYAIWEAKPSISSLTAVRCDSSGNEDSDGTYAKVTCEWYVDNALGYTGAITGTIAQRGSSSSTSFTFGTNPTGYGSVTSVAIVGSGNGTVLDGDTQYTVSVTVANANTGSTQSATRNTIITTTFSVMDWKAGGGAIGIGCAAPNSGLEVGYPVAFDSNARVTDRVYLVGNDTSNEPTLAFETHDVNNTWTNASAVADGYYRSYIKAFDQGDGNGHNLLIHSGGVTVIGSGECGQGLMSAINSSSVVGLGSGITKTAETLCLASDASIAFFVGGYGSDKSQARIAQDSASFISRSVTLDSTEDASDISADQWEMLAQKQDSKGNLIGYIQSAHIKNTGAIRMQVAARRSVSGTTKYNYIALDVLPDGTASTYVSAPGAFRSAISAYGTSGGTLTGSCIIKSSDINRDGTNPSSDTWGNSLTFHDKDGESIGGVIPCHRSSGLMSCGMYVYGEGLPDPGTQYNNGLVLYVDHQGNCTYSVSSAANFRNALGASSGIFPASVGGTGSAYYDTSPPSDINGSNVSVANNTNTTVATMTITSPGKYILHAGFNFASNATGRRICGLSFDDTTGLGARTQTWSAQAVNGYGTMISLVRVVNTTGTSYKIRANAYQNSGAALNCSVYMYAFRLK